MQGQDLGGGLSSKEPDRVQTTHVDSPKSTLMLILNTMRSQLMARACVSCGENLAGKIGIYSDTG